MCAVLPRILARETRCASPVASLPACDAPSASSLIASLKRPPFHRASGGAFLPLPRPTQTKGHHRWLATQRSMPPLETCTMLSRMETTQRGFLPPLWKPPRRTWRPRSPPASHMATRFLRSGPKPPLSPTPTGQARADFPRPQASGLELIVFRAIGEWLFGTKECSDRPRRDRTKECPDSFC
jgi:hypothetical protein